MDSKDQQKYRNSTVMDSSEKRESTIAVTAKGSWRGSEMEKPFLPETSRVGEDWEGSNLVPSPSIPFTNADMITPEKTRKKLIKTINKEGVRETHTKNMTRKEEKSSPYSSSSSNNSSLRYMREPESTKRNKLLKMTARNREKER